MGTVKKAFVVNTKSRLDGIRGNLKEECNLLLTFACLE